MSDTTMQTVTATDLKQEIRDNMRIGLNTMIWGGPGIGKSEIPQQVADDLNVPLLDFRANLFDPVDVRGIPRVIDNETYGAMTHGLHRIFFLPKKRTALVVCS